MPSQNRFVTTVMEVIAVLRYVHVYPNTYRSFQQ